MTRGRSIDEKASPNFFPPTKVLYCMQYKDLPWLFSFSFLSPTIPRHHPSPVPPPPLSLHDTLSALRRNSYSITATNFIGKSSSKRAAPCILAAAIIRKKYRSQLGLSTVLYEHHIFKTRVSCSCTRRTFRHLTGKCSCNYSTGTGAGTTLQEITWSKDR